MKDVLKNKKILILLAVLGVTVCLAVVLGIYLASANEYILELNVKDGQVIHVEYGDDLPDVSATYKGTIFHKAGTKVNVTQDGEVDLSQFGTYTVTYTAQYEEQKVKATVTVIVQDTLPPVIELVSNPDYYTSPKGTYEEEGYSAIDNFDGDISEKVVREEKDGIVYYTATDSAGNTARVERTIVYKDVVAPTITLKDGADIKVELGNEYNEPGYEAVDDCDGDITQNVEVEGTVNTGEKGTYAVAYRVKDSYDNVCEVTRTVTVGDFTAPAITLNGSQKQYIKIGTDYSEQGCKALDNTDGDITANVTISGSVDTSKKGNYTVKYEVADSSGNIATATRSVYVYENQKDVESVNPGDKVVYLTFDDGPGPYTEQLLNILDKYGVKVTFFVTNQRPDYRNMIGEAYRRGHTIALHTYSHQYSIYTSEETYYADLQKMEDICVEQTGVKPTIVRFPGGTSNTISRNYCTGIMSKLSESLAYHGYLYCDWNVSSEDAGGAKTSAQVAQNVINGIKNYNVSIVLQHDIHKFSVEAVEEIIVWGLSNGYTFLPLTEDSPMSHHRANN